MSLNKCSFCTRSDPLNTQMALLSGRLTWTVFLVVSGVGCKRLCDFIAENRFLKGSTLALRTNRLPGAEMT